jgi:hypothetical protein
MSKIAGWRHGMSGGKRCVQGLKLRFKHRLRNSSNLAWGKQPIGKHPIETARPPDLCSGHSLKNLLTAEIKSMDFSIEAEPLECCPSPKPVQDWHWKRTLDVLLILLVLPFLIPLALFTALLIRRGSCGPVLFRQERIVFQISNHVCGGRHDHASGTPASTDEFQRTHDEDGFQGRPPHHTVGRVAPGIRFG